MHCRSSRHPLQPCTRPTQPASQTIVSQSPSYFKVFTLYPSRDGLMTLSPAYPPSNLPFPFYPSLHIHLTQPSLNSRLPHPNLAADKLRGRIHLRRLFLLLHLHRTRMLFHLPSDARLFRRRLGTSPLFRVLLHLHRRCQRRE